MMKRLNRIVSATVLLWFCLAPVFTLAYERLRLELTEHTDIHHEFSGNAKSYGVKITNQTDSAITIERGITIEKETSSGWVQQSGIQAVANCDDYDFKYNWKAPVSLAAHSTLAVVPWDGFTCGGQCTADCLKNIELGAGTYRFVVGIVPGAQKIASPSFTKH